MKKYRQTSNWNEHEEHEHDQEQLYRGQMNINLHMLSALMMNRVRREVRDQDIVAAHESGGQRNSTRSWRSQVVLV